MIYTLGNSHSHFFTNSHPGELGWGSKSTKHFKSYSGNFLNPKYPHVLVHKFEERFFPHFIPIINSIEFTENDYIMFIVGEIDCRWNFPKKIKTQNRTIDDVLKEEIGYLFPTFLTLKQNGFKILGWGGHPSTTRDHHDPDPDDAIYGNCLFRNEISLKWNDLLKEKCDEHNIPFLSIIKDLIHKDGLTKMEYFMDDFHLNENAIPIVMEKFINLGILQ